MDRERFSLFRDKVRTRGAGQSFLHLLQKAISMICVTVTPTSRTLAKADLLNAARQGDIVELCLDHFHREPDVKDLISAIDKPMIVSCRRPRDGGQWQGTEEERLLLLRQAIVAGPAYIELDLDIAPQIPRFGKTQRMISFTRLDRPETDIDAIFNEAAAAKADLVKFTWPTPTLDAAWPLLAAVTRKRSLPVVGMGLGPAELTFSLLGAKYGSPWIYAALEKGMEAYPGQATVFELIETYHCHEIHSKTAFIAVIGFGPSQVLTTRIFNAGFQQLEINARCLPVELGDVRSLRKMLEVLKIRAVLVQGEHGDTLLPLADVIDPADVRSGAVNLLYQRKENWHGMNTLWKAALKTLEVEMAERSRTLAQVNTLVLGSTGLAQAMVTAISQHHGPVSLCGRDEKAARRIAETCECRLVPFQNLYETLADLIVIADPRLETGTRHGQLNPSLFRPTMTVLDVAHLPLDTPFLEEARQRGSRVIDGFDLYRQLIREQFQAMTGQELPETALAQGMSGIDTDSP